MAFNEPKKSQRFSKTQWSLVGRAGASDEVTRQQALSELLASYLPGLRAFLVETRRVPSNLADDLLQGFVADKVLMGQILRKADKGRGKFRNFILKSLSNYASTKLKREYAARAASLETAAPTLSTAQEADCFDLEWVRQVVQDALALMEEDCREQNRDDLWQIFYQRVAAPVFHGVEPTEYQQIVQQFDIKTPRQAINLLASAKRSFIRHLRSVVGKYADSDPVIDTEIADLRRILGS